MTRHNYLRESTVHVVRLWESYTLRSGLWHSHVEVLPRHEIQPFGGSNIQITVGNAGKDFSVTLSGGNVTCYALREGIERFLITDINNPAASATAQSEIPVMWDIANTENGQVLSGEFNHLPGGSNVLFLDGHVEFGKYPQPLGSVFIMLTKEAQQDGVSCFP